ncbi:MAG: type II toxin-antitoxin system VapC family toxin [Roseomonas sp.]|nr:type II toxin-antitoxin system VapC family toxin [Roseomonas sp.]MCA3283692.1 type II toxin-antitoxin system VapC family toxin [Roseomonas sp.]MCA3299298.1 type II toxin-antitoxin system VapC family toxin [Roseomonas sp.]
MTWLVDTNIISEVRKGSRCHLAVSAWWSGVEDRDLFLSTLTIGEIRRGVEAVRTREPDKARALEAWLQAIMQAFGPRILGIDAAVAESWGRISAIRSVPVVDALLAATASVHGLVLVTRNATEVAGFGVRVLNPFEPSGA